MGQIQIDPIADDVHEPYRMKAASAGKRASSMCAIACRDRPRSR